MWKGKSKNAQWNYAIKTKDPPMTSYIVDNCHRGASRVEPTIFSKEDAKGLQYPHCDALVGRIIVARKG